MPDGVNIPGGPSFAGTPQPPDVPCDPTGEAWRGPPGPQGPQGINGDVISGGPFLPLSGGHVTGKLQVGATGWLEAIIGATEQFSDFVSLSNIAGPGGVFGTRTSDGGATGGMGAWAIGGFAINNNTTAVQNAYGQYMEVRRYPNAGVTEGMEIGVINEGDVKQNQPYYIAQPGSTIGLFLGAGRDDVSPNNDCSMAIGITGGNALWDRGIIFNWNSVRSQPGVGSVAIGMPPYHALVWFLNDGGASHGAGVPAAVITCNADSVSGLAHPPTLLFGNGGLSFDPGNNSSAAVFAVGLNTFQATQINGAATINGTTTIVGTSILKGDVSIQDSGGAEHIHLTSSNGNIATAGSLTVAGATGVGQLSATSLSATTFVQIGGGSGPSWTTGSAAPAVIAPVGSLYSRTGGAANTALYISLGGGTWVADAADLSAPGAIGGTVAAAGTFTTLTATGAVSGAGFTTLLSSYLPLTGGTLSNGLHFGAALATGGVTDLTRHIELYSGGNAGFNVTSGSLNFVTSAAVVQTFIVGGAAVGYVNGTGLNIPIGQTTPNAGAFSTVSTSGQTELAKSNADTIIGNQAGNGGTATQGFLLLPWCAGAPTGAPANGSKGIAMQYDVATNRLLAYAGGVWRSVTFS